MGIPAVSKLLASWLAADAKKYSSIGQIHNVLNHIVDAIQLDMLKYVSRYHEIGALRHGILARNGRIVLSDIEAGTNQCVCQAAFPATVIQDR